MTGGEIQGEFEHHVLLATLRLEGKAYTSSLVVELEERTGREVAPAAVYIALRRLEKKGLVKSELRTAVRQRQRRERRFFRVTKAGVRALRESRMRLERLWDGLEPRLAEAR